MNVADIFAAMPERFNAEAAGDMDATLQFDLSGEGGGHWNVSISGGKVNVNEGVAENPTATIKMDAADYADLTSGKLNPMTAFMSGKVKVEGDLNSVMKFQSIFGM